jgi:hypothetical protein
MQLSKPFAMGAYVSKMTYLIGGFVEDFGLT